MLMGCGEIPLGTRVKHRIKGYEGWIAGWTDDRRLFDGHKTNSDKKTQCRIYIHRDRTHRCAAEEDLEVCNDLAGVLDHAKLAPANRVFIGGEDFGQMPVCCWIWTLGEYRARPLLKGHGVNDLTIRINNLKQELEMDGKILGMGDSDLDDVGYFHSRLHPILKKNIPIAIVPRHDPDERNWGLIKLVRRLYDFGPIDATTCLVRSKKIDVQHKLKKGEREKLKRHLDSIEVRNEGLIKSKVVLLLDDIVTTGASLMACKKLLLDAGASEVICLALGKATQ